MGFTILFALAALVLLAASAYLTVQAVRYRDLLRESAAVIALGLAGSMAYEAEALGTGRWNTISGRVADAFGAHPLEWLAWALPVPVLLGALLVHFTARRRQTRWFVFVAGLVAYVIGSALAAGFHWLP